MPLTGQYSLFKMIELNRVGSRYAGVLGIDREAEIFLLNTRSISESSGDGGVQFWLDRFRLAAFITDSHCRQVMAFYAEQSPPIVAFEIVHGTALCDLANENLTEEDLETLTKSLLYSLRACESIGLSLGGLTMKSVFRTHEDRWLVDVSGLISLATVQDRVLAKEQALLAPECKTLKRDSILAESDSAAAIYNVAILLQQVTDTAMLGDTRFGSKLRAALQLCLLTDPVARPRLADLCGELFVPSEAITIRSGSASRSSVPGDDEATTDIVDAQVGSGPRSDASAKTTPIPVAELAGKTVPLPGILRPGDTLGRYKIGDKLGEGAMGAVYRAIDATNGAEVAIKVMSRQVTKDSITARRFAKEARLLARANNPYVANLYEVNTECDTPYMAVELIEGGTLKSILKYGSPMDERLALTLLTDTARGLAIAHARGIVHRDFKPDNILLTRAAIEWMADHRPYQSEAEQDSPPIGRIYAKVADFGLARAAQQSESMAVTREGTLLGTPLYMSPEQCRGEAVGLASDVYSVGVTLFQMLVGKPPFESDSQVGVINKHCNEPVPSLKQLRPQISDVLVQLVEKCLAKNPNARYANAEELLVDLENILRGEPTSLGLHPPILAQNDPNVMRFEHSWELQSSPSQLWPYVSNTDRVNHAIGLPAVTYTTRQDTVHGLQRFAETKVAGQRIRWLEHPYEWIEGRRLSVLREFTHGPFNWFVNTVELFPLQAGGTRVVQTLTVTPKSWVGRQLAKLQLGKKSKSGFGGAYKQIDDYLNSAGSSQADPFVARTELSPVQRQKLYTRLESLKSHGLDPIVIETLAQYLENASDLNVARIRPLALAERFSLNATQVVNACLMGVKAGVFNLLWDIICPSCRIPANMHETLTAIKDHGYCEACNLNFGIDLMDSVELVFRAHPEIRDVETRTYCIGGPAWSRHVVAQVRLAADERFACELNLTEGSYMLRGLQLPFTIDFRVGHTGDASRIEFSLARPPGPQRHQLRLGSQVIHLCNDSGRDQQIRIERTAATQDALSAARASTLALFRELFPGEVLSSDQMVSVAHITLMRVKISGAQQLYRSLGDGPAFGRIRSELDRILKTVREQYGAVVKTIGEGVLASFSKPANAVQCAIELSRLRPNQDLQLSIAIHIGSAMVATLDDRLDYFGVTLQQLEDCLNASTPNCVVITSAVSELADVQSLLSESSATLTLVETTPNPTELIVHRLQFQVNGSSGT